MKSLLDELIEAANAVADAIDALDERIAALEETQPDPDPGGNGGNGGNGDPDPVVIGSGIWLSQEEIDALPMSGSAWETVLKAANSSTGKVDLSDQDSKANTTVLAKALVYAKTGITLYLDEVLAALRTITYDNTESGGRTLALGRELAAYVIAADLINLNAVDANIDADFRKKISDLRTKTLSSRTLISTHEDRPNNWGTHAGASRVAVDAYLGDMADMEQAAKVFRGWLGDREAYADFDYGNLSWQADESSPVGINPQGSTKDDHDVDGAQPEEMRRGGGLKFPPSETGYPWEALQGAFVQAWLLYRAGYTDVFEWEDAALMRAVDFLHGLGWEAEGDDVWQLPLINAAYGTNYAVDETAGPGKNIGWTAWTHGG